MFRDPFRDDPFFNLSNQLDMGFGGMEFGNLAIKHGSNRNNRSVAHRDEFRDMFGGFNSHFLDIQKQMQNAFGSFGASRNFDDGNGAFYSSSTVYSYTNDGSGNEPQIYQAHKSVKQGPGGIREEQRAERDSRKKEEKMAIARYMGERGKQTERRRNMQTGEHEENNDFFGIGESDDEQFNEEWSRQANKVFGNNGIYKDHYIANGSNKKHATISGSKKSKGSKKNNQAALEITDGSTKGRSRRHH